MRGPAVLCAAFALAALVAGPAFAGGPRISRPHRTVVAHRVNGAAAADGGHFAAWGNSAGGLRVLDDSSGFTTDIDLGRQCRSVLAIDGSRDNFLVSCRVSVATGVETEQLVVDAASGELTALTDAGYTRIGRYWVQGALEVAGHEDVIYTNWRTGERRLFRTPRPGQIYTPYDLDTPDLEPVALAGPEFVTGSSMALEQERRGRTYVVHLIGPSSDRVVYRSARRSQLLSVKGGLALWRAGPRRLLGYAYRSRRRLDWRVTDSTVVRGSTERRVYYLTPKLSSPQFSTLRAFAWR